MWTDWRRTSDDGDELNQEEETLDLATGEDITSVSGYSWDAYGATYSLQAETSAGRRWGTLGTHSDGSYIRLRSSPSTSTGLRLHHLSGDQTKNKYILRWCNYRI